MEKTKTNKTENWKKKYYDLKKELDELKWDTFTKEDKIKIVVMKLEMPKEWDKSSFLWKLSHEDLDLLIEAIKRKIK